MSISLVDFCSAIHTERMGGWLKAPHVVRWWGETSLDAALDRSSGGDLRVVEVGGLAVGFIRWQRTRRAELDGVGLQEIEAEGIDFDLLVGEVEFLGRGLGGRALALAMRLLEEQEVRIPYFSLGTEVANERAVRCFRKAGFAIVREFWEGDRRCFFFRKCPERIERTV